MAGTVASRAWIKRAILLIVIGLLVQLFSLVHVTPGTFLLFAFFGVGPMVVGFGLFAYALIRARREELDDGA